MAIAAAAARASDRLGKPLPFSLRDGEGADTQPLDADLLSKTVAVLRGEELIRGWEGWDKAAHPWLYGDHATETVRRHLTRYLEYGTVDPTVRYHEPLGPRHPISDLELRACIDAVCVAACHSKHSAEIECPLLRSTAQAHGCSIDYVWRAMQAFDPSFRCTTLTCKLELSEKVLAERLRYIARWTADLEKDSSLLSRVIWIDQKLIHLTPQGTIRIYICDDVHLDTDVLEFSKLRGHAVKSPCIYYYSAVNALMGPVAIIMCTGTKGNGAPHLGYQVRATVSGLLNACVKITKHTTPGSLALLIACAILAHHSTTESA
jgi:hypothetical protein